MVTCILVVQRYVFGVELTTLATLATTSKSEGNAASVLSNEDIRAHESREISRLHSAIKALNMERVMRSDLWWTIVLSKAGELRV